MPPQSSELALQLGTLREKGKAFPLETKRCLGASQHPHFVSKYLQYLF